MVVIDKFESVRSLLNEHNEAVGPNSLGFIDPEIFLNKVKQSGGTNDDRLKGFSHEDILEILKITSPLNDVKPLALAKDIAKIFRGKEDSPKQNFSSKKTEKMSLEELVGNFDPEDFNSPIAERLKKITRNQPFIVYSNGRVIDVVKSIELLNEIKKGFEGRKIITINNVPTKVYKIGELPEDLVDENPLYIGRPLRPDGTCDQLNRSWQGVSKEIRQLVRIAIELNEIIVDIDKAHMILDKCLNPNALEILRTRYNKASIEFDRRQKLGNLPLLLITLATNQTSDPFAGGKEVAWIPKNTNHYNEYRNSFVAIGKKDWHRLTENDMWYNK